MRFLSWGVSASGVVLGRAREFRCNGYASFSFLFCFFFSSRRRHTRCSRDWSSDVCSSDLLLGRVSSSQMNAELSRAQAVVVPSLAGEVFGLVLAENMQKALPLIVSDLGSLDRKSVV